MKKCDVAIHLAAITNAAESFEIADQLDKNYGYQTSQLFLASLPQVKSLQGGNLVNGITFAVNKLRADRLNNRG